MRLAILATLLLIIAAARAGSAHPIPSRAIAREPETPGFKPVAILGRSAAVRGVAVAPDGKLLASVNDREVMLWDLGERKALRAWPSEGWHRPSVAFSPDGKTLAIGRQLWDAGSGSLKLTCEDAPRPAISGAPEAVAFSPDGKTAAIAFFDLYHNTVHLFDTGTGACIRTLQRWEEAISWTDAVAFSPDGKRVAAGSDSQIRIWNAQTGALESTCGAPRDYRARPLQLAFTPDGKTLVSVIENIGDGRISGYSLALWNADTGERLRTLVESPLLLAAALAADGKLLAVNDGTLTLRNMPDGAVRATLPAQALLPKVPDITALAFVPGGNHLACGMIDGTIQIWSVP